MVDTLFTVYNYKDKFDSRYHNIRSFTIAREAKLIGTRNGFYYIPEDKEEVLWYTTRNSVLTSDIILSVFPYKDGYLIGTYGGGLYRFSPAGKKVSHFNEHTVFHKNSFSGVTSDGEGNIWFATSLGACMIDSLTGAFRFYDISNSAIPHNSTFCCMTDSKGRIWFGTSEGVCFYDPVSGVIYAGLFPEDMAAVTRSVRFIYEDRQGYFWFCDEKEGVVKMDHTLTASIIIPPGTFCPVTR
ncbi:MAG: hypothetical protein LUE93_00785 [Bacteroides sp.]|nr:hypothetical protein [Bacteroides sp.]